MISMNYYISLYMFLFSMIILVLFKNHLLLVLIGMEFMMIMIFNNIYNIMLILEVNLIYLIFFLSMVVCEGALGLSLVVLMVRSFGNDYINSLSLIKW